MIRTIYLTLLFVSCAPSNQSSIEQIDSKKVVQLIEQGVTVIDIRTPDEYASGHIPDVIHIDFYDDSFLEKMKANDIDKPIVIHCASGGRSAKAAKMLNEAGFSKIYDYTGGFSDWSSKGLKIEK